MKLKLLIIPLLFMTGLAGKTATANTVTETAAVNAVTIINKNAPDPLHIKYKLAFKNTDKSIKYSRMKEITVDDSVGL